MQEIDYNMRIQCYFGCMKNFDERGIHPKAQETLRVRAVRAVIEEGKTHQEVADLFGVARGTVTK